MSISLDSAFSQHLQSIQWFANCETSHIPKAKILKEINKVTWENIILHERGNFTAQLSRHHRELYKEWNRLVQQFKSEQLPSLQQQWEHAFIRLDLNEPALFHDISFNIISIALLKAYEDYLEFPPFFAQLLAIYENGQLPYGWKGSKTNGVFLVI